MFSTFDVGLGDVCFKIGGGAVWKELKNNTKHNVEIGKRENFYFVTVHDGKLGFCECPPPPNFASPLKQPSDLAIVH